MLTEVSRVGLMEALAPFHPRAVHFPIALLLAGALFSAAALLWRRDRWFDYGRTSLLLGWLGVLAAGVTGLIDQARAPQDTAVVAAIDRHITAGIALAVFSGLALYWPLRDKRLAAGSRGRWGYLALLVVVMVLVVVEGWLGGQLVYDFGVGVGPVLR